MRNLAAIPAQALPRNSTKPGAEGSKTKVASKVQSAGHKACIVSALLLDIGSPWSVVGSPARKYGLPATDYEEKAGRKPPTGLPVCRKCCFDYGFGAAGLAAFFFMGLGAGACGYAFLPAFILPASNLCVPWTAKLAPGGTR